MGMTTKLLGVIVVIVVSALTPTQLRAADLRCPAFTPPKVEITLDPPVDRIDTTKTLAQMRAAGAAGKIHHPAPVVGAYVGTVQYHAQIDDTTQTIAVDRVCATPKYATLKLSLERVIYIPREFADDRCLRSLSQEHETKHAEADAKALNDARRTFDTAVRAAIDQENPAATASDALRALAHDIHTAVDSALDKKEAAGKKLDDAIDNPTELKWLGTACDGRAAGGATLPP